MLRGFGAGLVTAGPSVGLFRGAGDSGLTVNATACPSVREAVRAKRGDRGATLREIRYRRLYTLVT